MPASAGENRRSLLDSPYLAAFANHPEIPSPATWLSIVSLGDLTAGLIILLADLNYRYVEQQLRRRGIRIVNACLEASRECSPCP
jgi:peptidoglycan/LPS O-acetylase OafA/YrhL